MVKMIKTRKIIRQTTTMKARRIGRLVHQKMTTTTMMTAPRKIVVRPHHPTD
jgi:hypothetical protein